jgi:CheY-like chemotaxis protein
MKVLLVEDKTAHADLVADTLEDVAEIITVDSYDDVKKTLAMVRPQCVILDLQIYSRTKIVRKKGFMRKEDRVSIEHGVDTLKYLVETVAFPEDCIFVTTSHMASRKRVLQYVPSKRIYIKPFSTERFKATIIKQLEMVRSQA